RSCGMHHLTNQGSKSPAGLNDWPLCAEWAAGSDGNRGRNRLENGHSRLDLAAVDQYRLHRFRNSVTFDLGGAVLRHDSNDDSADDGNQDDPEAEMFNAIARTGEIEGEMAIEREIRKQADQLIQQEGDTTGDQTNQCCEK